MTFASSTNLLVTLARIFREEGDTTTADALERQVEAAASRAISDPDGSRVDQLRVEAARRGGLGAHEEAEPLLVQALSIVEAAFGPNHEGIVDTLADLARCRFDDGNFEDAVLDYRRLLRIVERAQGQGARLAIATREQIDRCMRGMRNNLGVWRLQKQMDWMLFESRDERSVEELNRLERLYQLGHRLVQRGRHAQGIRLFDRWIAGRLHGAHPDDQLAMLDLRRFALAVMQAGQPAKALGSLRALVLIRNRRLAWMDDRSDVLQALRDWQACLTAVGDHRSAREAAALADAAASELASRPPLDGGDPPLRNPF